MILDKKVKVKVSKRNIVHYSKFIHNISLRDIIEIDPNLLQRGSNIKVNVKCDICSTKRFIKYQSYIFNIESCESIKIYTCDKCSHLKIKETNRIKYGADYFSQTEKFSDKIKKTSLEKFGVEHYSKTSEYLDKRTKTNMDRYGIDNPFRDINKIKNIFIEKFGVINPMQLEFVKQKASISQRKSMEENGNWIPQKLLSEYKIYKNKVRSLTRKNIKKLEWNGTDYYDGEYIKENFNLHYFDDNYPTIDHKISIFQGFVDNIPAEIISSVSNLCWTKRIINIKKSKN
jgi:uncharacterized protein YlaI